MYTITKAFRFSASHQLTGLDADHPCSRLHGHNYTVIVELSTPSVSRVGFVIDYGELKAFGDYLDANFDHRHLNDQVDFNPTAENLSHFLYRHAVSIWPEVSAVVVNETEKTSAEYRP